jgi:hypothetical protein
VSDGFELLRARRGDQTVSFGEIADHLFDYADLHPKDHHVLSRFAAFLTALEFMPHDHDADPRRGLPAQPRIDPVRRINAS